MAYTVKAVAELAGISIRTLHHYDEIGLLKPAQTSASGYRLYTDSDLERLQQVLFFKELDFGLTEIRAIVDSPDFDRRQALLQHRELLLQKRDRVKKLIESVDKTLNAMERGISMEKKDMFEGFDHSQYEQEAEQRWGQSEEYKESARRTKKYTKADWDQIKQEGAEVYEGLVSVMDRDPADPEVQEWVRRHHEQINKWFYKCSLEIYRNLGIMYVADERFTANIDKYAPGLSVFLRDAMAAYCDRLEGGK
ncbi:MAG TPA: MerR family transcriptional regulator [Symbiobacteriaceae bacterium]|nr:MerR family transcriptional regulator [Symbiobacteriaceae bacterium]